VSARAKRPLWRCLLLLSRVSNLPTVWSNVVAGSAAAAAGRLASNDWPALAVVTLSASLFYTGGMFLNDAFDAQFDRRARPERPIPRGEVSEQSAFAIGYVLLGLGLLSLAWAPVAMALGVVLGAAIVFYDSHHKGFTLAPALMGACRGLVYAIAAAAQTGTVPVVVVAGGLVMTAYVAGLTVVARNAAARAPWVVPLLIAGISVVDSLFIVVITHEPRLAIVAAAGFPLTLVLQRWVPGD
jgi:4-hydroxybenzoate polyprenyltransferase